MIVEGAALHVGCGLRILELSNIFADYMAVCTVSVPVMQAPDWRFQHPFQQHAEQIPSSTTRLTYLNFQQELLRDSSPLLVQVLQTLTFRGQFLTSS